MMGDMYVVVNSEGNIIDCSGYSGDDVLSLETAKERGAEYVREQDSTDVTIYKLVEVSRIKEYKPQPDIIWENLKPKTVKKKKPTKKGK